MSSNTENSSRVEHPSYYNQHPSGIECIDIVRYYNFNVGNIIKYLWRCGLKHEQGISDKAKALEDLKKARFYLDDEIKQVGIAIGQEKADNARKALCRSIDKDKLNLW